MGVSAKLRSEYLFLARSRKVILLPSRLSISFAERMMVFSSTRETIIHKPEIFMQAKAIAMA
jgi:hypothetical protein